MSIADADVLHTILHSQVEQIDPDFLRAILNSQLQHISPQAREKTSVKAVEMLSDTLNKAGVAALPSLHAAEEARMQHHLKDIRENGITLLGPVFSADKLKDIHSYLETKNVYGSHVWTFSDHQGKPKSELREKHSQVCYVLEDVLHAPHLLEAMSSPFLLKLVEQYLGCVPTVFQSNLMWSFQKKLAKKTVAQAFHRDWDNFRFCVLFIYLTDVDSKTGPHQYIRKSHMVKGVHEAIERYNAAGGKAKWANPETFYREAMGLSESQIKEVFGDEFIQIEQPAGYAFLTDAFGLHRGVPLEQDERLLFWARYGLYDNGFSVDVTPTPVSPAPFKGRMPDDKTHRYIFRSVLHSEFSHEKPPASMHAGADEFNSACDKMLARFGQRRFVTKAATILFNRLCGKKMAAAQKLKLKY